MSLERKSERNATKITKNFSVIYTISLSACLVDTYVFFPVVKSDPYIGNRTLIQRFKIGNR